MIYSKIYFMSSASHYILDMLRPEMSFLTKVELFR